MIFEPFHLLAQTTSRNTIPLLFVIGIFTIIITVVAALYVRNKKRLAKIGETLSAAGFSARTTKREPQHAAAFSRTGLFTDLRTGSDGVQWSAIRQVPTGQQSPSLTLVEHMYSTGSGKNRQVHYHTIAAIPCPDHWPSLTIVPEGFLTKIAEFFGKKDFKVEDEAFNKRWRVTGDSEDFAIVVLSPDVQRWFMSLDKQAGVRIGRGAITVFRKSALKPEHLVAFSNLPGDLWKLLPPELSHFVA